MAEIPDDVVELAAREYCDFDGGLFDSMRHVLSLPEVRAALAPSPVPVVSYAERLAKAYVEANTSFDAQRYTIPLCMVDAFQALIDDGTIPPEPVPDVAEMLAAALSNSEERDTRSIARRLMADGWQFTPPPLGTEKGGE